MRNFVPFGCVYLLPTPTFVGFMYILINRFAFRLITEEDKYWFMKDENMVMVSELVNIIFNRSP